MAEIDKCSNLVYQLPKQSTSYKICCFESSFWPYLALRMLHFALYPIKLGILEEIVSSVRFFVANLALILQFAIRYLIALSNTANIISLSYILCQLLGVL